MTNPEPATTPRPARRRTALALALAGAAVAATAGALATALAGPPATDRQAEVADRGREVMPFDLDRTTHRFAETPDGGVQTVVADNPGDRAQIALVRRHLRDEADRFAAGDFADPARIHGEDMPGLAELRAAAGRIEVRYADVPDGAVITYATADPVLVDALHRWFDAQLGDHGGHAEHG
jgi:hypothetical protein